MDLIARPECSGSHPACPACDLGYAPDGSECPTCEGHAYLLCAACQRYVAAMLEIDRVQTPEQRREQILGRRGTH